MSATSSPTSGAVSPSPPQDVPNPKVYYLANRTHPGVVKIGTAVDVGGRVRRLVRRMPSLDPIVLATEPGGPKVESARHRQFADSRLQGEWFWLTPDLAHHIDGLSA